MKDKINAKLEEKRTKRVQVQTKLPNVNKDLFLKLKDLETTKKKSKTANLVKLMSVLITCFSFEHTDNYTIPSKHCHHWSSNQYVCIVRYQFVYNT